MPELPEVETVRLSLAKHLEGALIENVTLRRSKLRYPLPIDLAERLQQRTVTAIERVSKYLLLRLDGSGYCMIHLGMSGQCLLSSDTQEPQKHDHVLIDFRLVDHSTMRLSYRDPRRFGMIDLIDNPKQYPAFTQLGREAIFTEGTAQFAKTRGIADADYLYQHLHKRQTAMKNALLDQRIIAGLGNIYVIEALWECSIHPKSPCSAIPHDLYPALASAIEKTLSLALKSGGSSLRDFVDVDGSAGYFQHQWQAYQRLGEECRLCGGIIDQTVQSGRSSFFCPEHQKMYQ